MELRIAIRQALKESLSENPTRHRKVEFCIWLGRLTKGGKLQIEFDSEDETMETFSTAKVRIGTQKVQFCVTGEGLALAHTNCMSL